MTEQQPTSPPVRRWSAHPDLDSVIPAAEPWQPRPRTRPAAGWPKTGNLRSIGQLADDEQPVSVPARAYDDERDATVAAVAEAFDVPRDLLTPPDPPAVDVTKPGFGIVSIAEARSWGIKIPPAVELIAMADDLNTHGGLDEEFVAALLRAVVNDTPPPEQPADPLTYQTLIETLEQRGLLRPTPRPNVADLTGDQLTQLAEQHVTAGPRPDAVDEAHAENRRQAPLADAIKGPWISADAWERATRPGPPRWRRALDRVLRRPR
ncbi:hypothetical protein [Amycolatopsis sp. NPDC051128]|uniref:hypothetical protein n=1 Tax=Amycolatopsis sp. NPDC051128 TaxID=3155412 RepID=UPI00343B8BBE